MERKNFKVGEGEYYGRETKILFLNDYVNLLVIMNSVVSVCLLIQPGVRFYTDKCHSAFVFLQPVICMMPPFNYYFRGL